MRKQNDTDIIDREYKFRIKEVSKEKEPLTIKLISQIIIALAAIGWMGYIVAVTVESKNTVLTTQIEVQN